MCVCDNDTNDKGCCCCLSSRVGVWIIGILYVLGFLGATLDVFTCKGINNCAVNRAWSDDVMWVDVDGGQMWNWNE